MKKLIVVLLILLSCIPLFARTQFGLSLSYDNMWLYKPVDDTQIRSIIVALEGGNDFGSPGGIGIEYSLGFSSLLNVKNGSSVTYSSQFKPELLLSAGFGWWHYFNEFLGFAATTGMRGTFSTQNEYVLNSVGTSYFEYFNFTLSLYFKLAAELVLDPVKFSIGCSVGLPLFNLYSVTDGANSSNHDLDISGFYASPYISASFVF